MAQGRPLSLLWPDDRAATRTSRLAEQTVADLQLRDIARAMVGGDGPAGRLATRERFALDVLADLATDPELIAYRQAALADLLDNSSLRQRLEQQLPALEALGDVPHRERYRPTAEPGLERVARRLADLELLVEVVGRVSDALHDASVTSAALRGLHRTLMELRTTPEFVSLERELPGLRATLASIRSVTVGVNLGPDLTPQSATILELGTSPI